MKNIWLRLLMVFLLAASGAGARASASGPSARRNEAVRENHGRKLSEFGISPSELRIYSIGKSHIDAAFTWRLAETRGHKAPLTWRQALEHIREFPDFTYHQSSAQFYEWIQQDDPALFREIQAAEKRGRWVIVGGMWIEPDANMPDGESLARQFLYGQRFFIENFGHPAGLVWLEDTFGFNWNLPQIARKSRADSFYTLKMLWNIHNQFPFHLFYWQAPDGSRLLAHITPILSAINPALQSYFPYSEFQPGPNHDFFLSPLTAAIAFPWDLNAGYRETRLLLKPGERLTADYLTSPSEIFAKLSDEPLPVAGCFYGAGDGGHGPTRAEIEDQLALQAAGYAQMGTTDRLYADFASFSERLPVWNDELYLEYHQGVFTTHERVKRQNREAESGLRQLESAAAIASLLGMSYPADEIRELWKLALLNQFHDILPGTGIQEVYQDADAQYEYIHNHTGKLIADSLSGLTGRIAVRPPGPGLAPLVVFNPLGWERGGPAYYPTPGGEEYRVFGPDGRELPAQTAHSENGDTLLYFVPGPVPALGWTTVYLAPGASQVPGGPEVQESGRTISIENDLVKVYIDRASGAMMSLVDKKLGRELLAGPSNTILAFTDHARGYPAWNISEDYPDHPLEIPPVSKIEVTDRGPVLARVLIERTGKTSFKQWITVYRDSAAVGLVTWTDLHWKNALIKLEFNTNLKTPKVPAEIPYAVIERSTRPQVAWDAARAEMPCNKWLDFSDGRAGLALLNFGAHGFSITPDGQGFRMSIVKSAPYPRPELNARDVDRLYAWRLRPAMQTDPGEHWSYLALMPHPGGWREGKIFRAGYEFNTPAPAVSASAHDGDLPAAFSPIIVKSPSAVLTAIKQAEDDEAIVVRLVESEGLGTEATLEVAAPFILESAAETDLLELNPQPLVHDRRSLLVPMGPFEIKTLKLFLREN